MTMKQTILVVSFLLTTFAFAQTKDIQIKESKVYKMTTARVQNDYILPDENGGFITISSKRSGFLVNPLVSEAYATHYDQNLNLLKTKTFKLNKGSIKGTIKGAFVHKQHLYLINMEQNLRKRYYSFKKMDGDIQNGTISSKEFFHIDFVYPKNEVNLFVNPGSLYYQKLEFYSDVNFFNPKIFIRFSKNNRFFTIVYRDLKAHPALYHIQVFNREFEPVFKQKISFPVASKLFYINDLQVDDTNGDVYLATQIYRNDPLKKRRLLNTDNTQHFKVYHITKDKVSTYKIKPEKVMEKLHILIDKNLSVFGFYRDRYLDLNNIDGFYRLNLTKELSLINSSYQKFKQALVSVGSRKGLKKTKNHSMVTRQSFVLPNGDLIVNAEDLYVPQMMKKEDREAAIREIAGNLFSIKVRQNGDIIWAKKIYKKQIVKPRLALHSFFGTYLNGTEYLLFTDSPLEKTSKNKPFYLQGSEQKNLNLVTISSFGAVQKSVLYQPKRKKFRFMPIEGIMIAPKTAIIPAKDHLYIKFFKIIFP